MSSREHQQQQLCTRTTTERHSVEWTDRGKNACKYMRTNYSKLINFCAKRRERWPGKAGQATRLPGYIHQRPPPPRMMIKEEELNRVAIVGKKAARNSVIGNPSLARVHSLQLGLYSPWVRPVRALRNTEPQQRDGRFFFRSRYGDFFPLVTTSIRFTNQRTLPTDHPELYPYSQDYRVRRVGSPACHTTHNPAATVGRSLVACQYREQRRGVARNKNLIRKNQH